MPWTALREVIVQAAEETVGRGKPSFRGAPFEENDCSGEKKSQSDFVLATTDEI